MKEYIMPKMEIMEIDCEEMIAMSFDTENTPEQEDVTANGKFRNGIFDLDDSEGFKLF